LPNGREKLLVFLVSLGVAVILSLSGCTENVQEVDKGPIDYTMISPKTAYKDDEILVKIIAHNNMDFEVTPDVEVYTSGNGIERVIKRVWEPIGPQETKEYSIIINAKYYPPGKYKLKLVRDGQELIVHTFEILEEFRPEKITPTSTPSVKRPTPTPTVTPPPLLPGEEPEWLKNFTYSEPISHRTLAVRIASNHPGEYNTQQIYDLYDFVHWRIKYVSDPSSGYAAPPDETIQAGGGDCDDQAILLAAMIEDIGGTALVGTWHNETEGHAFTLVYFADDEKDMKEKINEIYDRYSWANYVQWISGEINGVEGCWLILDPTGANYPGRLHPICCIYYEDRWEWREGELRFYEWEELVGRST